MGEQEVAETRLGDGEPTAEPRQVCKPNTIPILRESAAVGFVLYLTLPKRTGEIILTFHFHPICALHWGRRSLMVPSIMPLHLG